MKFKAVVEGIETINDERVRVHGAMRAARQDQYTNDLLFQFDVPACRKANYRVGDQLKITVTK